MSTAILWVGVFVTTYTVDYVWTKYIAEVGAKRAHRAAIWSTAMIPLAAIAANVYTSGNHWLLIPAAAGAYLSTWQAVQRETRSTVG